MEPTRLLLQSLPDITQSSLLFFKSVKAGGPHFCASNHCPPHGTRWEPTGAWSHALALTLSVFVSLSPTRFSAPIPASSGHRLASFHLHSLPLFTLYAGVREVFPHAFPFFSPSSLSSPAVPPVSTKLRPWKLLLHAFSSLCGPL